MSDELTQAAQEAVAQAVAPAVGDAPVVSEQVSVTAVHVPGAALETVADKEAREAKAAEAVADPEVPVPAEYAGIDTRTPEGNLATRSNIVADGPGTVADFLTKASE
jgi:hypothetical protein